MRYTSSYSIGILVCAVLLGAGSIIPTRLLDPNAGVDFLQYWSAARVAAGGGNPYDRRELLEVQDQVWRGGEIPRPVVMWNPPQALTPMLPLAVLPFARAYAVWFAVSLGLMIGCCWLCLRLYAAPCPELRFVRHARLLFLASFPPFAASLYYGQISPLLLGGFCLALWAQRSARPLAAGFALSLTIFKPHLLYLYYLYFVIAELRSRRVRGLAAFAAGAVVLSLLPLGLQPHIFYQYAAAYADPPIAWRTPTIGAWLQGLLGVHRVWLRTAPTVIAAAAALPWLLRSAGRMEIERLLPLLIPLSLVTSPYGWQYDQMLLLPAVMIIFARGAGMFRAGRRRAAYALVVLAMAANAVFFLIPAEYGQETTIWYPACIGLLGIWAESARGGAK